MVGRLHWLQGHSIHLKVQAPRVCYNSNSLQGQGGDVHRAFLPGCLCISFGMAGSHCSAHFCSVLFFTFCGALRAVLIGSICMSEILLKTYG